MNEGGCAEKNEADMSAVLRWRCPLLFLEDSINHLPHPVYLPSHRVHSSVPCVLLSLSSRMVAEICRMLRAHWRRRRTHTGERPHSGWRVRTLPLAVIECVCGCVFACYRTINAAYVVAGICNHTHAGCNLDVTRPTRVYYLLDLLFSVGGSRPKSSQKRL